MFGLPLTAAFIGALVVLVFTVRRPWSADAMYLRALDEMHSDEARDFLLRLDLTDAEFADLTAQLDYACRKFELVIWNAGEKPNAGEEKEESNE